MDVQNIYFILLINTKTYFILLMRAQTYIFMHPCVPKTYIFKHLMSTQEYVFMHLTSTQNIFFHATNEFPKHVLMCLISIKTYIFLNLMSIQNICFHASNESQTCFHASNDYSKHMGPLRKRNLLEKSAVVKLSSGPYLVFFKTPVTKSQFLKDKSKLSGTGNRWQNPWYIL